MTGLFRMFIRFYFLPFWPFYSLWFFNIARRVRNIMSSFSPKTINNSLHPVIPTDKTTSQNHSQSSSHGSHKIFDDNEGEYVDYEEIK